MTCLNVLVYFSIPIFKCKNTYCYPLPDAVFWSRCLQQVSSHGPVFGDGPKLETLCTHKYTYIFICYGASLSYLGTNAEVPWVSQGTFHIACVEEIIFHLHTEIGLVQFLKKNLDKTNTSLKYCMST